MDKLDFLLKLEEALSQLPEEDRQASIEYYAELIDDRIEDGMPENEAVESLGSVEKIAEQILMDMPLGKLVKSKVKNRRKMRGCGKSAGHSDVFHAAIHASKHRGGAVKPEIRQKSDG